jgi:hypothetical protein
MSDEERKLVAVFERAGISSSSQESYLKLCREQRLTVAELRTQTRDGLSSLGFRSHHQSRLLRALAVDSAANTSAALANAAADAVAKRRSRVMDATSPPPPPTKAPPPPTSAPPAPTSTSDQEDSSFMSETSEFASESDMSESGSESTSTSSRSGKKAKKTAEQVEWMAAAARANGDGWRVGPVSVREGTLLRHWVWHILALRDGKLSLYRGPLEGGLPIWSMPADEALELVPPPREKPGKFTIVVRHARTKANRQFRVATLQEKQDWLRSIYTRHLASDVALASDDASASANEATTSSSTAAATTAASAGAISPRDVEGEAKLKSLTSRRDALLARAAKVEAEKVGGEKPQQQTAELLTALELQAQQLTDEIEAETALQQSLAVPERNRNAMRRRRAAKVVREAVAARRDAHVAVEQCQTAVATFAATVSERAGNDAKLRHQRVAYEQQEERTAEAIKVANEAEAKLTEARRAAAEALKVRNELGKQRMMADAAVAQASSSKAEAARTEAARVAAALATAERKESSASQLVNSLSEPTAALITARVAAVAERDRMRTALASDELAVAEQGARDKLETQRRRDALTAAQAALERATVDLEAAEAAERVARRGDGDGDGELKKSTSGRSSSRRSSKKETLLSEPSEFTAKANGAVAEGDGADDGDDDGGEWAWSELSAEEQSKPRDAYYLANRERIDSASHRLSLLDGNALLHAQMGGAIERDTHVVILHARCRMSRRMSSKRAKRRRRHRDGTTTSAPERRRATEVDNKEGTLFVTKMALYFLSFDDGAERVQQTLSFDEIADLQPVQSRRIAARLSHGDRVLFSSFVNADVRDEMQLAVVGLWTNRREEAMLRKYKLSAIQAEMEFANLAQEVGQGTHSDDEGDDASHSTCAAATTDQAAPAAAAAPSVSDFTADVSAILQQEVAQFRETFNTPRDEPLVVVCGAKLSESESSAATAKESARVSGTLYVAPNYVCFAQDQRSDASPQRVRVRWRNVVRVERRVQQSFIGFLDSYVVDIEHSSGTVYHLTALSKNLDDVCDAMRACWLASSKRVSLFGAKLRDVWPKPSAEALQQAQSQPPSQAYGDPTEIPGQPVLPLMVALGRRIIAASTTEGLFRTSPSALELERAREALDDSHWAVGGDGDAAGSDDDDSVVRLAAQDRDVAPQQVVVVGAIPSRSGWRVIAQLPIEVCCALYKNYLRTLPDPLLTFALFECFMVINPEFGDATAAGGETGTMTSFSGVAKADLGAFTRERAVSEPLSSLLRMLPYENYCALRHVLWVLDSVAQQKEVNKMTLQSLASIFGPVLLRDKQSEKDEALLSQAAGHNGTDLVSAAAASRTAQLRAAEAFQLNYKVSLLLLYMLHNRREVLGLAEEDVARATLALDPPTLPRPPKVPKTVSWRDLSVGLRPDRQAPEPPAGKKRRQKAKASASKIAKHAAEQLREKKKALSRKWGKLARTFSANLGAKERSAEAKKAADQALCQLCHEKKIAVRVQFASTAEETSSMTPEQRMLMLCRECVMCSHCGTKRIAARLTVAVSAKAKPPSAGQSAGERKHVSVYVCGDCCAQYESEKAKLAKHRADLEAALAKEQQDEDDDDNDDETKTNDLDDNDDDDEPPEETEESQTREVDDDLDYYGLASDDEDEETDDFVTENSTF